MISFLNYFEITRDEERCSELENNFQTSLEHTIKQIENEKSEEKRIELGSALRKFVATVDDWINLVTKANDVAKTDFHQAVLMYEAGMKRI